MKAHRILLVLGALAVVAVVAVARPPGEAEAAGGFGGAAGIASIDGGSFHTCLIRGDGRAQCWGSQFVGALGDGVDGGLLSHSTIPVLVTGLTNATGISVGGLFACARISGGTVKCWGANDTGQLGHQPSPNTDCGGFFGADCATTPVAVQGLSRPALEVTAGSAHACALLDLHTVECWGGNGHGQLGDGTTTDSDLPVAVPGLTNVRSIGAGTGHTCALLFGGAVKCWGLNNWGQLGNGTFTDSLIPVAVSGLSNATKLDVAQGYHTCAIAGGSARCWGRNLFGELGKGDTISRNEPTLVNNPILGEEIVNISGGFGHTCAASVSTKVWCWGHNDSGELGDGSNTTRLTPVSVCFPKNFGGCAMGDIEGVVELAAGFDHTCARGFTQIYFCWGKNSGGTGQLGDGTTTDSNLPVEVRTVGLRGVQGVVDAGRLHTCFGVAESNVDCAGHNFWGQIGDGTTTFSYNAPMRALIEDVIDVSGGGLHTCAVVAGGTVSCWGRNTFGQLGNGTNTDSNVPVQVTGITDAVQVTAGENHSCALHARGRVSCWGANDFGQLGDAEPGDSNVPSGVIKDFMLQSLNKVTQVAAGSDSTCALLADGKVKCWGRNSSGQLGNGNNTDRPLADEEVCAPGGCPSVLTNVVSIDVGTLHACAVVGDGTALCWGSNGFGQLGTGDTTSSNLPTGGAGLPGVVQFSLGSYHSCGVISDGTALCWGRNDFNQVSTGSTADQLFPVSRFEGNIPPGSVVGMTAGEFHSCVMLSSGGAACWGRNHRGQLGDGTFTDSEFAVVVLLDSDGDTLSNTDETDTHLTDPFDIDTDDDGCRDDKELLGNQFIGGQRDPTSFWDFFDVWTHPLDDPTAWVRDQVVNVPGDIIGTASRFGPGPPPVSKEASLAAALTPPTSDSGYHAGFDRGPVIGANN